MFKYLVTICIHNNLYVCFSYSGTSSSSSMSDENDNRYDYNHNDDYNYEEEVIELHDFILGKIHL